MLGPQVRFRLRAPVRAFGSHRGPCHWRVYAEAEPHPAVSGESCRGWEAGRDLCSLTQVMAEQAKSLLAHAHSLWERWPWLSPPPALSLPSCTLGSIA